MSRVSWGEQGDMHGEQACIWLLFSKQAIVVCVKMLYHLATAT